MTREDMGHRRRGIMNKMRVTVDDVMLWGPCPEYSEERVRALFGRRKYMTASQILDLEIPAEDRIWAVLHEELLTDTQLRMFACDCAERVLRHERRNGNEPDGRSWAAVRVSRRYARGLATDDELADAQAYAMDAFGIRVNRSALAAASTAVLDAECAAYSAHRSLLGPLVRSSSRTREWRWQIARLRKYANGEMKP